MSIKRTIITTVVALALVATVAPVTAGATTIDDLLAQIAQLTAQLNALQSGSTTTTTVSATGACAGVTFSRNLTVGSTGSDVKCLQTILNRSASTQIATTGAGSPGAETTYFGSKTLAAVKIYQAAKGFTPANQVGPMTRAALNAEIGSTTSSTTTTTTTTSTGPVSATLAYDNPAAGALINSQATGDLLHINFTGSGTVTSVTLQRSGISTQNTLTNVYLYDGNTRITDGYSFNSTGTLTINGLSIAVNGSKVISVKADTSSDAVSYASSVAVAMTSYTANGTTTSSNVQGNTFMIVTGSAATVVVSANAMTSTATINAGTSQYTFWTNAVQVNTRAVLLKTANFRMIGSAPSDALANIKLFVDGVDTGKVATVITISGSNYAMFDLTSAPITLTTGSHTVDVRADVQKGTNRTVQLSLQQAADLTITDPQVGVNIAAVGPLSSSTSFAAAAGTTVTINYGSTVTTVDSSFGSQTNISGGAAGAVIGKFTVHAYGEDVKVSSIQVTPTIKSATSTGATCTTNASGVWTSGTCGLNNVTLYFNGSQIGSQQNWTMTSASNSNAPLTFTLGSQMIIPAGQDSTIEVRADLQTAASISYTGGSVTVTLEGDTDNAYGQSSQYTVGVPQTTDVTTNGLTIQTGNLVVAANTNLLSQSISPSTAGVKIGSYIVQNQSTSESVRLTQLTLVTTNSGTNGINNLSGLRTSDTTGSGSTPIQPTGTDTFSVNDTLTPGQSITIDIFANTGSDTTGTVLTKLTVASIGVTSNIAAAGTQATGQSMTLGVGTVYNAPTLVVSSSTPAQYIAAAGGAQNATQATFNFVSTSGASTINELKFVVTGTDATPTQTVTSVCVGSVCAQPVSGVVTLTGLSLAVPNGGGGLTQDVKISYSNVGTGGITPGSTSTLGLAYIKYLSGGSTKTLGTSTTCTATLGTTCDASLTANVAANDMTLVGSKPTVTVTSTSATGLNIGTAENKIGEITVTADAKGNVKLNDIKFAVTAAGFTTNPTFTLARLADGSTTIAGSSCGQGTAAQASQTIFCEFGSGTLVTTTGVANVEDNTDFDGYMIAAGQSKTFSLYATVNAANITAGTKATITTSLTAAGFNWDDVSTNGAAGSYNLNGTLLYNFPSNSYSITQ